MARLRIFTDGGARGNPGPSACAFVVLDDQNKLIFQQGFYLGYGTNNQAEYLGVVKALEWLGRRSAIFYLDSLLVVKQIKGEYKIKDIKLKELYDKIKLKIENCKLKIDFVHVPREQNSLADALVNKILNGEYENG